MTAFAVVTEYARLLVWPARLSPDYSYNQIALVTSAGDRFIAGAARGVVSRRHRAAVAPQSDRGVRTGVPRADLFDREQLRRPIGTICAERRSICRALVP